jgi:predicted acylesterase/phospholipase RssA
MGNEKEVSAQSLLRSAKEWFRAFGNGFAGAGERRPKVGLALAGGFARGIAHIGVLRVAKRGFRLTWWRARALAR